MDICLSHAQMLQDISEIKTVTAVTLAEVKAMDKRINGSVNDAKEHIRQGIRWRMSIVGIVLSLAIQLLVFSNMWGKICRTVENNTERITDIEQLHPRVAKL